MKKKAVSKKSVRKMKAKPKAKFARINMKLLNDAMAIVESKAKRHAGGNVSAWLRHAGVKYVPKKGETILATELRPQRK